MIRFKGVIAAVALVLWSVSSAAWAAAGVEITQSQPAVFTRSYHEQTLDLSVKVKGGAVQVERALDGKEWTFNRGAQGLQLEYKQAQDVAPSKISRFGESYVPLGNPQTGTTTGSNLLYVPEHSGELTTPYSRIEKTDEGYRWSNQKNIWEDYNPDGDLLATGERNLVQTKIRLDAQHRVWEVQDAAGNLLLTYEYTTSTSSLIKRITDYSGRAVSYEYSGNQLIKVVDVLGGVWSYRYDTEGRLIGRTDPENNVLTIKYDVHGDVSRMEDGQAVGTNYAYNFEPLKNEYYIRAEEDSGRVIERWLDASGTTLNVRVNGELVKETTKILSNGQLVAARISDGHGYWVRKDYDQWTNVTRQTYPDGSSESASYDHGFNLISDYVNQKGVKNHYDYDGQGNVTRVTEAVDRPEQRVIEFTYDADGQRSSVTSVGDEITATATTKWQDYDRYGNPQQLIDAEGYTVTLAYNVLGLVTEKTDARGNLWKSTYDAAGNLLSSTDPLGRTTTYVYDKLGRKLKETKPNSAVTEWGYGSDDQVKSVTGYLAGKAYKTLINHDRLTQKVTVTDPLGHSSLYEFNQLGQLAKQTDPNGNNTSYHFSGPNLTQIDYPTFTQKRVYDSMRRLTSVSVPYGSDDWSVTSLSYNGVGERTLVTDPNGHATQREYDSLGRVIRQIDALGGITLLNYDNRNNLLKVTDPESRVTRYEYDRNNRLTAEIIEPDPGVLNTRQWIYDGNGNLKRMIAPDGRTAEHDYDAANQRVATHYYMHATDTVAQSKVTFTYNKLGLIASYDDGKTSQSFEYDDWGRLLQSSVNFGPFSKSFSYSYDAVGHKLSYTNPEGGTYSYTYDAAGNTTGIKIPGEGLISYAEYQWRKPGKVTYPGGAMIQYQYDSLQRQLNRKLLGNTQNALAWADYSYDKVGNVSGIKTQDGDYQYTYDALRHLILADNPGFPGEAYTYDGVGNRLTAASVQGTWRYNGANELLGFGETEFEYNANGDTVKRKTATDETDYSYNVVDRLAGVSRNGIELASYTYNPFGLRIAEKTAKGTQYLLFNQEGLSAVYDEHGILISQYQYRPDSPWMTDPVFQRKASYRYSYTDHLGASKGIFTGDGISFDSFRSSAFGVPVTGGGVFGFPGQVHGSEVDLDYNFYRDYDPGLGRYVERDPIGLNGGVNPYVYVNNNSFLYTDPKGLNFAAGAELGAYIGTAIEPGLGTVAGGIIGGLLGAWGSSEAWNWYNNQSSEPQAPVPDATPGNKTNTGTQIWDRPGSFDDANNDFDNLNPSGVEDKGGGVRVGTLPNGDRIIVRPRSTDGSPTIEIQRPDGKRSKHKIRYCPSGS